MALVFEIDSDGDTRAIFFKNGAVMEADTYALHQVKDIYEMKHILNQMTKESIIKCVMNLKGSSSLTTSIPLTESKMRSMKKQYLTDLFAAVFIDLTTGTAKIPKYVENVFASPFPPSDAGDGDDEPNDEQDPFQPGLPSSSVPPTGVDSINIIVKNEQDMFQETFRVTLTYTFVMLKAVISERWSIAVEAQRLLHEQEDMLDSASLEDNNIKEGDCLSLLIRGDGGVAKKTIKTIIKSKGTDRTTAEHQSLFENAFKHSVAFSSASKLDVQKSFSSMTLDKLEEVSKYLLKDKTPNAKKVPHLATFIPEIVTLIEAQQKLNTAVETAKQLVVEFFEENCADKDDDVKMPLIVKWLDARIAIKKEMATSSMET